MRQPEFWDDAAKEACGAIFAAIPNDSLPLEDLRNSFDYFVDNYLNKEDTNSIAVEIQWISIGSHAIALSKKLGARLTVDSVTETLIRKQRDYGHENIRRFGRTGLIIRCHDKIARLENLCGSHFEPNNESIDDTLLDIVGYSAIGIMWERQNFLLELAPPKKSEELLARGLETR
jgi:hypothetical protein